MTVMRNLTSVPRNVRLPRSRPFCRMGRRSKGTIIWSSTLVRLLELVDCHQDLYRRVDYEYGRLLACQGDKAGALKHFEYVTTGKAPESNPAGWKGKYSMEVRMCGLFILCAADPLLQNNLNLKTHAAAEALALGRRL